MHLSRIYLNYFRNIESATIDFGRGVNILWGDNAQGKSNVLEAIYFCARGKSFRGAHEKQLITHDKEFSAFRAEFYKTDADRMSTLAFTLSRSGKKVMLRDEVEEKSLVNMVGRLHAVMFTPQHLTLVTGSPAERREFMNIAISLCYPPYIRALATYNRTLEERNALLRQTALSGEKPRYDLFEIFAQSLAEAAAAVVTCRADFVRKTNVFARQQLSSLSRGMDYLSLSYIPRGAAEEAGADPVAEEGKNAVLTDALGADGKIGPDGGKADVYTAAMQSLLMSDLPREIAAKTTLYGPHRDDIGISLNGRSARSFASQGQTRSIALALKMAEGQLMHRMLGERPVYLLDDVLSELDEGRREFLLTELRHEQIILTSCEPDFRIRDFEPFSHITRLHVQKGKIKEM
ncbi:MAG: DNA replication and repair protein RecF [Clostridia bacterium]|nr:DNA replication and repair protein RecF [Clostridia bacterium]